MDSELLSLRWKGRKMEEKMGNNYIDYMSIFIDNYYDGIAFL